MLLEETFGQRILADGFASAGGMNELPAARIYADVRNLARTRCREEQQIPLLELILVDGRAGLKLIPGRPGAD